MKNLKINLKLLTLNRERNQVGNANWIRTTMACGNGNQGVYFFRGKNQEPIKSSLCSLNDSRLEGFFVYVSRQIDFNGVRKLVGKI